MMVLDLSGRGTAVVIGLDSHGIAVARALSTQGIVVHALEKDMRQPGVASKYVAGVWPVRSYDPHDLLPALKALRERLPRDAEVVLHAINDRHVETIARHLDELLPLYRIAWALAAECVLRLQRKDELEAHSRQRGLLYPRSAVLGDAADAVKVADFAYPLIVKPVRPQSSFKTLLVDSPGALAPLLARHAGALPVLVQEYIAGDDSSLFFGALVLDRGRVIQGMVGRKIASYPPARGQTTIALTADESQVLEQSARFFEGTGISGPASLELKRDPQGRFWVIEPTVGRTDHWLQLCISAGLNQPLLAHAIACGQPCEGHGPLVDCVWYDTERDPLAYARLCRDQRTLRPLARRQVFPYWGHGDLRPWVCALRNLAARRARMPLAAAR